MVGTPIGRGFILAMAAVSCCAGVCPAGAADAPDGWIEAPIAFLQIPAGSDVERRPAPAGGTLRADYGEGGRIVRLDPGGQVRVLTGGFDSACELDVSFDAKHILFAARRSRGDPWSIWEMTADGSGARQITRDLGNCRSPAYQATLYTIISAEPWYQIMFVSDMAGAVNECGTGLATSLYSCKLDGTEVRRLTVNLSNDMDPFLMDDGRVLLAGWQRMDLRRGPFGRVALFGVNTDGTDYALFCGDQGKRVKHMPCVTTDGLVVFVEGDKIGWDGAGQLGSVTLRRNFHSYRPVTQDATGVYHSPSPLRDGAVLVSRRPTEGSGTHGLYRLNPSTGHRELLFDDPEYQDVHAKILSPRPVPDGRSSVVNEKYLTGKLYCLNAYLTEPADLPHVQRGMIRSLRIVEGVPLRPGRRSRSTPVGASNIALMHTEESPAGASAVTGLVPVVQRRLLGYAPVEEDGSFHVELPADVPVELQTTDANGMALRSCGWIWVKHREPRGCIGCHEDPELTPENRFVKALQRPATMLTLPAGTRRTVDFRRDIAPVISGKCARCHMGGGSALDLRCDKAPQAVRKTLDPAYVSLLADIEAATMTDGSLQAGPVVGKYVHPGQARTSPLIWRIFGRNTSRPWDASYCAGQTFAACPPPDAEQLTEDEKLTFIEWIDLGAHWGGVPASDARIESGTGNTNSENAE